MIILDSDHLSILQHAESSQYDRLITTMDQSADQEFATTAISLEEQMRGWLAAISRARGVRDQLLYYAPLTSARLTSLVDFYSCWNISPLDEAAADRFVVLRKARIRIGTMDLNSLRRDGSAR